MDTDKLRMLKAQKTRLLNKPCENLEEFEEIQNKINEIELQMNLVKESK